MSYPVFYVPAGDVLPVFFASYDGGTGASAATTGLAVTDIEIYKDGSVTQRSSDAGYTLLDTDGLDFDGITGINGFSIDTGDNTDSGFYTVGSWFTVVVSAVTVDAQTVSFIACQFRLMAAESVAAKPKVDVDAWLGTAAATPTTAGVPEVDMTHIAGSAVSTSTAQIGVNAVQAGGTAWGSGAITAASIANGAIDAATFAADVDAEARSWLGLAAADLDTQLDAIVSDTGEIGVAGAGLTNINLPDQTMNITGNITGNLSGSVGSVTGAVGSVTGAVGSVTGNVGGNVTGSIGSLATQAKADVNAEVDSALATDLTEAYAAAGDPGSVAELLYEMRALLAEKSISSTTLTTKKLDGSTTAATYTLDDATNPSSITRAT